MSDKWKPGRELYVALYDAPTIVGRSYPTILKWSQNVGGAPGTAALKSIPNPKDRRSLLVEVDDLVELYVRRNTSGWTIDETVTADDGRVISLLERQKR